MSTLNDWNLLKCSDCKLEPHTILMNEHALQTCEHCGKKISIFVYPALANPPLKVEVPDAPIIAEESSCFYHAGKQASVVCDDCGRFLCNLCDIDIQGRHVCTLCLDNPDISESTSTPKMKQTHYDSIALIWAAACFFLWIFAFIPAGISLYYTIRHWKTPISITHQSRWRFVVATLISIPVLCLSGFFMLQLIGNIFS